MELAYPLPPVLANEDEPDDAVDDIIDLTDRRRVLLHLLFGVTVPVPSVDAVFSRRR